MNPINLCNSPMFKCHRCNSLNVMIVFTDTNWTIFCKHCERIFTKFSNPQVSKVRNYVMLDCSSNCIEYITKKNFI